MLKHICSMGINRLNCKRNNELCGLHRPSICPELIRLCYSDFNDDWVEENVKRKENDE